MYCLLCLVTLRVRKDSILSLFSSKSARFSEEENTVLGDFAALSFDNLLQLESKTGLGLMEGVYAWEVGVVSKFTGLCKVDISMDTSSCQYAGPEASVEGSFGIYEAPTGYSEHWGAERERMLRKLKDSVNIDDLFDKRVGPENSRRNGSSWTGKERKEELNDKKEDCKYRRITRVPVHIHRRWAPEGSDIDAGVVRVRIEILFQLGMGAVSDNRQKWSSNFMGGTNF
ncbi:hypothetical protein TNCV_3676391 [Trichonephila clavipes]|nr:hypothetical protein TNCV_3676391 [Trichonephila clavipes]